MGSKCPLWGFGWLPRDYRYTADSFVFSSISVTNECEKGNYPPACSKRRPCLQSVRSTKDRHSFVFTKTYVYPRCLLIIWWTCRGWCCSLASLCCSKGDQLRGCNERTRFALMLCGSRWRGGGAGSGWRQIWLCQVACRAVDASGWHARRTVRDMQCGDRQQPCLRHRAAFAEARLSRGCAQSEMGG